jgi:hypothetical protein
MGEWTYSRTRHGEAHDTSTYFLAAGVAGLWIQSGTRRVEAGVFPGRNPVWDTSTMLVAGLETHDVRSSTQVHFSAIRQSDSVTVIFARIYRRGSCIIGGTH